MEELDVSLAYEIGFELLKSLFLKKEPDLQGSYIMNVYIKTL